MLKHYKGELGAFTYDDEIFEIRLLMDDNLEYIYDMTEYIHYKGKETDGSKITIPKGLLVANYMFYETLIETPPVLPKTIVNTNNMFDRCYYLKEVCTLPPSVSEVNNMFSSCHSLQNIEIVLPYNVHYANNMFEECINLRSIKIVCESTCLTEIDSMFKNCKNLETCIFHLPSCIIDAYAMFKGCIKLKRMLQFSKVERLKLNGGFNIYDSMYEGINKIKFCYIPKFVTPRHKLLFFESMLLSCDIKKEEDIKFIPSLIDDTRSVEARFRTTFINEVIFIK